MTTEPRQSDSTKPESTDPLLQPLTIGNLVLKNRVMSASHACGLDDEEMPGERYQRYHEDKAKGGLALTMFGGSSNVAVDSPSIFRQLSLETDRIIPYLEQFSDRIHAHGTALMCQITHLGRRGDAHAGNWLPTIAPSAVRETLHRNVPKAMDRHDIDRVVRAYGAAARRCMEGQLDGIETLAGGHLIGQFFSKDVNRRTDEFGGSLENRARFALMTHAEIRRQVGDEFLVGMRLSIDEGPASLSLEDALTIGQLLEREGAVDFFNLIVGRMDTELALAEQNIPGMSQPLAPYLATVAQFGSEIGVPIFHGARITDVANARHAVREGILDMVAMTRAHIADPEIVNKITQGNEDRIRPCIGASHCLDKKPHCLHNASSGREVDLPQVVKPSGGPARKVVVVGGGPAGLEAARVASERGHEVVLFEAASRLGGQVVLAARSGWRRDLIAVVDWRSAELSHLGVRVHLDTYAEAAEVLAENPDVVIVATGGLPVELDFPGAALCVSTWDILSGNNRPADRILVCDGTGRHQANVCAEHVARGGAAVQLATIDDRAATEMGYAERVIYRRNFAELGVATLTDQRVVSVRQGDDCLVATLRHELTGTTEEIATDQVIVEQGTTPLSELYCSLRPRSSNDGVTDIDALAIGLPQPAATPDGFTLFRIGDAVTSRSIHAAILDAFRLALGV